MIIKEHTIRIRYSESDQMGFVHHSNYIKFFEIGRIEFLREMGVNYKDLEAEGIGLPVIKIEVNYLKPLFFDDEILIKTFLKDIPNGPRIIFHYQIFNQKNEKVTESFSELVFMNMKTKKPIRCPEKIQSIIEQNFH